MRVELVNSVGAPDSLDVRFFEEVLENVLFDQESKIKKVSIENGSSVGDNFCSQIYRVKIEYHQPGDDKLKQVSVIVKSLPRTKENKFVSDLEFYLKEKIFYVHILPRMEVLLDNVRLGGRMYFSAKEPINTLAFEDLTCSDYIMADRSTGLDLEHCLIVMKKLGNFHAASMILKKKDPNSMKFFHSGMLSEKGLNQSETLCVIFKSFFDALLKVVDTWEGYEKISKKLQKYGQNFKQNLIKSQLPKKDELKVLNHGDMWVNNLLFKYKNKQTKQTVLDAVFIDFQMSVYGSPGIDLNYFFYTSVQLDILREKREELLRAYHKSMCETLSHYNFDKDTPTFEEILTEFRQREAYGLFANFGIFPAISMSQSESSQNTLENLADKDSQVKQIEVMFSAKRLRDTMRYTLKRFDELGVLDEFL